MAITATLNIHPAIITEDLKVWVTSDTYVLGVYDPVNNPSMFNAVSGDDPYNTFTYSTGSGSIILSLWLTVEADGYISQTQAYTGTKTYDMYLASDDYIKGRRFVWSQSSQNNDLIANASFISYYDNALHMFNSSYTCYSSDNTNWTQTTVPSSIAGCSIIYDGTAYIALDIPNQTIYRSTDYSTWTSVYVFDSSVSSQNLWDAAFFYKNGRYCIANRYGSVILSSNGTTWTAYNRAVYSSTSACYSIIADDEKFIAVVNKDIYTSPLNDGTTWTKVSSLGTGGNVWRRLLYTGHEYIAMDNDGWFSYSYDCINWTTPYKEARLGKRQWDWMWYDKGKLYAYGNQKYIASATLEVPDNLYAYANSSGTQLYAWTNNDTGSNITFWTTTDSPTLATQIYDNAGNNVTTNYLDGQDARINTYSSASIGLAYADYGFYLPVSNVSANTGVYVYYRDSTKDTIVYSTPTKLYTDTTTIANNMVLYNDSGADTTYTIGEISSGNFELAKARYQTFTLPNSGRFNVAYGNGKWVAVKCDNMNMHTSAYISENGFTWSPITLPVAEHWWGIAYGNGKFVITSALNNTTGGEYFLYSSNGYTWTSVAAPEQNQWYEVVYGGDRFVAVGGLKSAYSTNGTSWSTPASIMSDGSIMFREAAYGNGTWLTFSTSIYANTMGAKYSTDGAVSWTDGSGYGPGNGGSWILKAAYANNIFACISTSDKRVVWWSSTAVSQGGTYYIDENISLRPTTNICTYNNKFFNVSGNYFAWSTDASTWSVENSHLTLPAINDICSDDKGHFVAMPQSGTTGIYITLCPNF